MKIAILELKNPYEQIFVRHPVYIAKTQTKKIFPDQKAMLVF